MRVSLAMHRQDFAVNMVAHLANVSFSMITPAGGLETPVLAMREA
jgi:hypothetical protein